MTPPTPPTAAATGDLQKIDVKFGVRCGDDLDWDVLLGVFGRWRLEAGEEIVDLADYAHVPHGPSCILISKRWQFGIDFTRGAGLGRAAGWCGLMFSSRKGLDGDVASRVRAVTRAALERSSQLLAEPELSGRAEVLVGELDVVFNDRLLFANTDASDARARPAVAALARALYGAAEVEIAREADPGRRLGYALRASPAPTAAGALSRLA